MKRFVVGLCLSVLLVVLPFPVMAGAKSIGGCPVDATGNWQLVTVASLGIPEEIAVGIASLDGNGDGWTCVIPVPASASAPIAGAVIFRDNTVGA